MNVFKENYLISYSAACIPISATCNCACAFCSNKQNPFDITSNTFIDLKTFTSQLYSISNPSVINLSDTLPGKNLSEGEAIIHPQFFEIMKIVRERYPQTPVFIRTNGIALTEDFLNKLLEYKPLHIEISFPCLDSDLWAKTFSTLQAKQSVVLNAIEFLSSNKIPIKFSMVPMPEFVGLDKMEDTIRFFSKYSKFIHFWKAGWTDKSDPDVVKMLQYDASVLLEFITRMQKTYNMRIENYYIPDVDQQMFFKFLRQHFDQFGSAITLVILTSQAAYSSVKALTNYYAHWYAPINYVIDYIPNKTFGGNIDCAGLLTFDDIGSAIEKYPEHTHFICPPPRFLDRMGNDLLDNNIGEFFRKYNGKSISLVAERSI